MKLLSLSVWLGLLLAGVSYAAPASQALGHGNDTVLGPVDDALVARSVLEKREVFFSCSDQQFSVHLTQAIHDAREIISNAVDHLELAISLYNEDGSGRLKESKGDKSKRTFDEHNAFATYSQFISELRWTGDDAAAKNKAGLDKIKVTRDLAKSLVKQYDSYIAGQNVPWLRGGIPYARIYCNDADYLSDRDSQGRTYAEANPGKPNWFIEKQPDGKRVPYYMLLQSEGIEMHRKEVWVARRDVCPLRRGPTQFRFGLVPARKGVKAYVTYPRRGLLEETMTFCPAEFERWIAFDEDRTAQGIHYRDLHVKIGESPSPKQIQAINTLRTSPEVTAEEGWSRGMMWLGNFLTATMIHESTHSQAFVGGENTLIDVKCTDDSASTDPQCMRKIAKGVEGDKNGEPQGHRDAEMFAAYAMATYANAVHWFRYKMPGVRGT